MRPNKPTMTWEAQEFQRAQQEEIARNNAATSPWDAEQNSHRTHTSVPYIHNPFLHTGRYRAYDNNGMSSVSSNDTPEKCRNRHVVNTLYRISAVTPKPILRFENGDTLKERAIALKETLHNLAVWLWEREKRVPTADEMISWIERFQLDLVLSCKDWARAVSRALWRFRERDSRVSHPIGCYLPYLKSLIPTERLARIRPRVTHDDLDIALICFTLNIDRDWTGEGQCGVAAVQGFFKKTKEQTGRGCERAKYYRIQEVLLEYGVIVCADRSYLPGVFSRSYSKGKKHPDLIGAS